MVLGEGVRRNPIVRRWSQAVEVCTRSNVQLQVRQRPCQTAADESQWCKTEKLHGGSNPSSNANVWPCTTTGGGYTSTRRRRAGAEQSKLGVVKRRRFRGGPPQVWLRQWREKPSAFRHSCKDVSFFFGLVRLSRHYLPPVADYGEKNESEVRKSPTVQKR